MPAGAANQEQVVHEAFRRQQQHHVPSNFDSEQQSQGQSIFSLGTQGAQDAGHDIDTNSGPITSRRLEPEA